MKKQSMQIVTLAILLGMSMEFVQGAAGYGKPLSPQPYNIGSSGVRQIKTIQQAQKAKVVLAAEGTPPPIPANAPTGEPVGFSLNQSAPIPGQTGYVKNMVTMFNNKQAQTIANKPILNAEKDGFSIDEGVDFGKNSQNTPPPLPKFTPQQQQAAARKIQASLRDYNARKLASSKSGLPSSDVDKGGFDLGYLNDGSEPSATPNPPAKPPKPTNIPNPTKTLTQQEVSNIFNGKPSENQVAPAATVTGPSNQTLSQRVYNTATAAGNAISSAATTTGSAIANTGRSIKNTVLNSKKSQSLNDQNPETQPNNSSQKPVTGKNTPATPPQTKRSITQAAINKTKNAFSKDTNQYTTTETINGKPQTRVETRSKPTKENPQGKVLSVKTIAKDGSYTITSPEGQTIEANLINKDGSKIITKYNPASGKPNYNKTISKDRKTITETVLDDQGRPEQISEQVNGKVTSYQSNTYNTDGSRINKTTAQGKLIESRYDAGSKTPSYTKETRANRNVKETQYDSKGNPGASVTRNAQGKIIKQITAPNQKGEKIVTKPGRVWGERKKTVVDPNFVAKENAQDPSWLNSKNDRKPASQSTQSSNLKNNQDNPSWVETPPTEPSKVQENAQQPSWVNPNNDFKPASRSFFSRKPAPTQSPINNQNWSDQNIPATAA